MGLRALLNPLFTAFLVFLLLSSHPACWSQEMEGAEEPDFVPMEEIITGRVLTLLPTIHISLEDEIPSQGEERIEEWGKEVRDLSMPPKLFPLPSGSSIKGINGFRILGGGYGTLGGEIRFGRRKEKISITSNIFQERTRWADPKSHRNLGGISIDLGFTPMSRRAVLMSGIEVRGGALELPTFGKNEKLKYDSQERIGLLMYLRYISDLKDGLRISTDVSGSIGIASYGFENGPDELSEIGCDGSAELLWVPMPGHRLGASIGGRMEKIEFLGNSRGVEEIRGRIGYDIEPLSFLCISVGTGIKRLEGDYYIDPEMVLLYRLDPLTSIDIGFEGRSYFPNSYKLYVLSDYLYPNLFLKPQRGMEIWSRVSRYFGSALGSIRFWRENLLDTVTLLDRDEDSLMDPVNLDALTYGVTLSIEAPLKDSMKLKLGWDRRYSQTKDKSKLPYYPKDIVFARAEYRGPWRTKVELGLDVVGKRYADLENLDELPGYNSLDISISWMPLKDISVFLKLKNLMDSKAILYKGYEMPGRNAVLGVDLIF